MWAIQQEILYCMKQFTESEDETLQRINVAEGISMKDVKKNDKNRKNTLGGTNAVIQKDKQDYSKIQDIRQHMQAETLPKKKKEEEEEVVIRKLRLSGILRKTVMPVSWPLELNFRPSENEAWAYPLCISRTGAD